MKYDIENKNEFLEQVTQGQQDNISPKKAFAAAATLGAVGVAAIGAGLTGALGDFLQMLSSNQTTVANFNNAAQNVVGDVAIPVMVCVNCLWMAGEAFVKGKKSAEKQMAAPQI